MDDPARLMRLSVAQGQLARLLEMQLQQMQRRRAELSLSLDQLRQLTGRTDSLTLPFLASGLRTCADTEETLKRLAVDETACRQRLIAAKMREAAFARRAGREFARAERARGEAETLETSLAMTTKASGKHDVVD